MVDKASDVDKKILLEITKTTGLTTAHRIYTTHMKSNCSTRATLQFEIEKLLTFNTHVCRQLIAT